VEAVTLGIAVALRRSALADMDRQPAFTTRAEDSRYCAFRPLLHFNPLHPVICFSKFAFFFGRRPFEIFSKTANADPPVEPHFPTVR
jgi:hypothetical protein